MRPFMMALTFIFIFFFSAAVFAGETKRDVPFREDSGLTKAEAQISEGKYMQAIDTLGGVLTRHPASADAYAYLGYAYGKLGDQKRGAENYAHALEIDPRHLGANKYVGDLYLATGDVRRAIEQLQVIKMVCAGMDCAEMDALQADINNFNEKKTEETESPNPPSSK